MTRQETIIQAAIFGLVAGISFYVAVTALADAQRVGLQLWQRQVVSEAEQVLREVYDDRA